MTNTAYNCFTALRRHSALLVATVALAVALVGVPGVTAGGLLVTTKNVKNNSLTSADIKKSTLKTSDLAKGSVRTADIGTGAVQSADIGEGEVTPSDVTMPDPVQLKDQGSASANFGLDFALLDSVGTYAKQDPTSVLSVDWTGTVNAPASACVFQLRVDGQSAPDNTGQIFVFPLGPEGAMSVSAKAIFPGLPTGPHTVEIWAKINSNPGISDPCVVGPPRAGIPQTYVVEELVV